MRQHAALCMVSAAATHLQRYRSHLKTGCTTHDSPAGAVNDHGDGDMHLGQACPWHKTRLTLLTEDYVPQLLEAATVWKAVHLRSQPNWSEGVQHQALQCCHLTRQIVWAGRKMFWAVHLQGSLQRTQSSGKSSFRRISKRASLQMVRARHIKRCRGMTVCDRHARSSSATISSLKISVREDIYHAVAMFEGMSLHNSRV